MALCVPLDTTALVVHQPPYPVIREPTTHSCNKLLVSSALVATTVRPRQLISQTTPVHPDTTASMALHSSTATPAQLGLTTLTVAVTLPVTVFPAPLDISAKVTATCAQLAIAREATSVSVALTLPLPTRTMA